MIKRFLDWLFEDPAYVFDEKTFQEVFGSDKPAMTIEITYTERQQADELSRMENVLQRMAYSKNESGMRYEGHEEAAMALTHVRYLIHELKLRRCTDGEGHVSHEFFADSCTRCGSSL
jgi:hypothetical protein